MKHKATHRDASTRRGPVPNSRFEAERCSRSRVAAVTSQETGTTRKLYPGYSDLTGLAKATSIYQEDKTNYKVEERKILKEQKEIQALFESLKAREKNNETET